MKCEEARENCCRCSCIGELSFDEEERLEVHIDECPSCRAETARQRRLHQLLDESEPALPEGLLTGARLELRSRLRHERKPASLFWSRLSEFFTIRMVPAPAVQFLGAIALVAAGFFGARIAPFGGGDSEAGLMGATRPSGCATLSLASRTGYSW